uniref:Glycine N-acyltransferase-like protein n=1 Tax=Trichuris muris TaxID=70415 RepID=A0A5S6QNU1_TRIMR
MNQPLEIFVDDWPNPAVVVIRSKSKWGNISNYPTVYTFSLHEEFEEFAASDKLMSVFLETSVDLLKESLNKLDNGNLELKVFGSTRTFWIPPVDQETLRKTEVTLPDGFQFDELLPQEAEMVDSLWVHRFDGSVDHVRRFIVLMPNVCVRKSDGKLAGFAMVHDFMGNEVHLFTMPEFRGKRIAFNIEIALAKKVLDHKLVPCKFVVTNNCAAMQMTLNSPYWKEMGSEIAWLQVVKPYLTRSSRQT